MLVSQKLRNACARRMAASGETARSRADTQRSTFEPQIMSTTCSSSDDSCLTNYKILKHASYNWNYHLQCTNTRLCGSDPVAQMKERVRVGHVEHGDHAVAASEVLCSFANLKNVVLLNLRTELTDHSSISCAPDRRTNTTLQMSAGEPVA